MSAESLFMSRQPLGAFDLKEIFAAFFGDEPGGLFLAMQRVGGDCLAIQRGHGGQAVAGQLSIRSVG
jgi:hypothetical protein